MHVNNQTGVFIVLELINVIHKNKTYLSEIDGAIGDGDHGINMDKAFAIAGKRIAEKGVTSLSEGLEVLGRTLIMDIGGSIGPLYGTFFREMAKHCEGLDVITGDEFGHMLNSAYAGLRTFDKAQLGDKSLQDTLVPALEAYNKGISEGLDFKTCLEIMVEAARNGWLSTKDMVAKIGRASRLGERSRGILDPGATSCFLILESLANSINTLI